MADLTSKLNDFVAVLISESNKPVSTDSENWGNIRINPAQGLITSGPVLIRFSIQSLGTAYISN